MQSLNHADRFFNYLNMHYLIAPFLIKLIYWIGIVVILSAGVGSLFASIEPDTGNARVPLTIVATIMTLLLWRLLSELMILAFNIYARLIEIRDLLSHRQGTMDEEQHAPPPLFLLKKPAPPFDDQGTA